MGHLLWQFLLYGSYFLSLAANGFFLFRLCAPFVRTRRGRVGKAVLFLLLMGTSGMVIWVGDPNMLYTLPVFFTLFLLCTQGDYVGRLAVCVISFCLIMSACAFLDTYIQRIDHYAIYDVLTRLARPAVFGAAYLLLRRRLPREEVQLSRQLWKLVLGLSAMPLCALIAVVLLTYEHHSSALVDALAKNQGLVVLPFAFLTSLALLFAMTILAGHQRLEEASRLTGLREVYYQNLQQQERQVRTLRHDLRNHLTVVRGLLEGGDAQGALGYLDQIAGSPALRGTMRLCENETANVVLAAKAEEMAREGLTGDFAVSLPKELPVADTDLCALLGNALDNAMEAARQSADKRIIVRCRAEKELFMLRLENAVGQAVRPDLSTTKADKSAHGFGLAGMREIAERCGGTMEARVQAGRFELVVCFPLSRKGENEHAASADH